MTGDQLHGVADHFLTRSLDPRPCGDHDLRAQTKTKVVRLRRVDFVEDRHGRAFQIDDDLGGGDRQTFAGADIERHTGPAPGVDMQAQRGESLDLRIRRHARFCAVAAKLAAYHLPGIERAHGTEQAQLLGPHSIGIATDRRVHCQQRRHLQQMVLHHVADGADLLVKAAAALHAEILRHRDLDTIDEIAIPDRL